MILRCADFTGSGGQSKDDGIFEYFVVFAFFYIVLVQLIGILLGDRSPIQVLLVFALLLLAGGSV